MTWIKLLIPLLGALAKVLPTALTYWLGKRRGEDKARLEQRTNDLKQAADALRARRDVEHDPDSVRNDARNRDAD